MYYNLGKIFIFLLFLQLHPPDNVFHRLGCRLKTSSCPIGHPDWLPENTRWRGFVPRTAELPTATPGRRLSPPWMPGRRDNLREKSKGHGPAYRGQCVCAGRGFFSLLHWK